MGVDVADLGGGDRCLLHRPSHCRHRTFPFGAGGGAGGLGGVTFPVCARAGVGGLGFATGFALAFAFAARSSGYRVPMSLMKAASVSIEATRRATSWNSAPLVPIGELTTLNARASGVSAIFAAYFSRSRISPIDSSLSA